jgi:hypothetical protein
VYVVPFLTLYTQLAKNHSVGIRLVFMLSMLGDELPTLQILYTVSSRSSLMSYGST